MRRHPVRRFFRDKANALAGSWTINSIAYSIVYPFIPIYLYQTRHLPMEQAGLVFPVMASASIFVPPLAGWLSDHLPRTWLMRAGQGGRALLFFSLALLIRFEAPFWLFCIFFFLNAGTGVIFENSADAYLSSVTTPAERAKAYSKIRIGTNIGWAAGPALGAFLASLPYDWLFFMTSAICFGSERYIRYVLPERKRCSVPEPGIAKRRLFVRGGGEGGTPLWKDRYIMAILCGVFLMVMLTSQLYSVLSVYSTHVVGITKRNLGFVYFFNGFTIIIAQIPVTLLLTRLKISHNWRLVIGTLFYFFGYFLLSFAHGFLDLVISVIILTMGEIIVQVALYAVITAAAPPERVGRYLSGWVLTRGVAASLGPYVGSLLFARFTANPLALWSILSSFGLLSALVFAVIARRKRSAAF